MLTPVNFHVIPNYPDVMQCVQKQRALRGAKHRLACLAFLLLFWGVRAAQAQSAYVGLSLHYLNVRIAGEEPVFPTVYVGTLAPALQLGVPVADALELRAALSVAPLSDITFGADALYRLPLSEDLHTYLGLGPDFILERSLFSEPTFRFDLHGTAGLEFRLDYGVGVFGEAKPRILSSLGTAALLLDLKTGVNVYF